MQKGEDITPEYVLVFQVLMSIFNNKNMTYDDEVEFCRKTNIHIFSSIKDKYRLLFFTLIKFPFSKLF